MGHSVQLWDSPGTVGLLNVQAVHSPLQHEPALLPPSCSEGISPNPVLHSLRRHPPAGDSYNVCGKVIHSRVLDDSAAVALKRWAVCIQGAGDGPTSIYLSHHLAFSQQGPVLGDMVLCSIDEFTVSLHITCAAHHIIDGFLGPDKIVHTLVGGAGDVRDGMLVDEFVGQEVAASMARTDVRGEVEQNLRRELHLGDLALLGDDETVGEGTSRSVCPAGATRRGQELVGDLRDKERVVNVAPIEILREIGEVYVFMRLLTRHVTRSGAHHILEAASSTQAVGVQGAVSKEERKDHHDSSEHHLLTRAGQRS